MKGKGKRPLKDGTPESRQLAHVQRENEGTRRWRRRPVTARSLAQPVRSEPSVTPAPRAICDIIVVRPAAATARPAIEPGAAAALAAAACVVARRPRCEPSRTGFCTAPSDGA